MKKGRFIIAAAVFLAIAIALPLLANFLPDHTKTLANAPAAISRAYVDRVVNYVVNGRKSDLVVAGSSLVIFPHILTDGHFEKVPIPVLDPFEYADFLRRYVDMAHFRSVLGAGWITATGKPMNYRTVVDLGVPSLMLSDCDLLFRKLEDNDLLPAEVILLLAPRDFMDNTVAAERNLFEYEINGRLTAKEISKSSEASAFFSKLSSSLGYWSNAWGRQFRTCGQKVVLAAKKFGRQPKSEIQKGEIEKEQALHHFYFGDGKLADLVIYKKRYNPPDHARIKEQLKAMEALLGRLKASDVRVFVVSMPLTEENIALIDKDAHAEIIDGMRTVCLARSVPFIPAQDLGPYSHGDFLDSVHLNAVGGDKFFKSLARKLASEQ